MKAVKKGGSPEYIKNPSKSDMVKKDFLFDHRCDDQAVLFSIHPRWADLILEGIKTSELRKTDIRRWTTGGRVFIYATSPVSAVIGSCTAGLKTKMAAWALPFWPEVLEDLCISADDAGSYLQGSPMACIYGLQDPVRFDRPVQMGRPPQSFRYLDVGVIKDENPE